MLADAGAMGGSSLEMLCTKSSVVGGLDGALSSINQWPLCRFLSHQLAPAGLASAGCPSVPGEGKLGPTKLLDIKSVEDIERAEIITGTVVEGNIKEILNVPGGLRRGDVITLATSVGVATQWRKWTVLNLHVQKEPTERIAFHLTDWNDRFSINTMVDGTWIYQQDSSYFSFTSNQWLEVRVEVGLDQYFVYVGGNLLMTRSFIDFQPSQVRFIGLHLISTSPGPPKNFTFGLHRTYALGLRRFRNLGAFNMNYADFNWLDWDGSQGEVGTHNHLGHYSLVSESDPELVDDGNPLGNCLLIRPSVRKMKRADCGDSISNPPTFPHLCQFEEIPECNNPATFDRTGRLGRNFTIGSNVNRFFYGDVVELQCPDGQANIDWHCGSDDWEGQVDCTWERHAFRDLSKLRISIEGSMKGVSEYGEPVRVGGIGLGQWDCAKACLLTSECWGFNYVTGMCDLFLGKITSVIHDSHSEMGLIEAA